MKREITVKRTEYGFVTVDIPDPKKNYDVVYDEYMSGNVIWGKEELEIVENKEV